MISKNMVGIIYGGREDGFRKCYESLKKSNGFTNVFIGVNKKDPFIEGFLKETGHPHLWYGRNIGHFQMINKMLDVAKGAGFHWYFNICDDVVIRDPDWMQKLLEAGTDPEVGVVGPKEQVVNPLDVWENNYAKEFAMVLTGFRLRMVAEVGGMDPQYFWYSGDSDYCWMVTKFGWKIKVIDDDIIDHTFSAGRDLPLGHLGELADQDSKRVGWKWDNWP